MLAHSLTVERLRAPEFWAEQLLVDDGYGRWVRRKLATYRGLVAEGEVGEMVEEYAARRLALGPPHRRLLNKADGRKKVVFTFDGADELLLKALNRILQPATAADHSRLCHSFQPGRGPRTAYRYMKQNIDAAAVETYQQLLDREAFTQCRTGETSSTNWSPKANTALSMPNSATPGSRYGGSRASSSASCREVGARSRTTKTIWRMRSI